MSKDFNPSDWDLDKFSLGTILAHIIPERPQKFHPYRLQNGLHLKPQRFFREIDPSITFQVRGPWLKFCYIQFFNIWQFPLQTGIKSGLHFPLMQYNHINPLIYHSTGSNMKYIYDIYFWKSIEFQIIKAIPPSAPSPFLRKDGFEVSFY